MKKWVIFTSFIARVVGGSDATIRTGYFHRPWTSSPTRTRYRSSENNWHSRSDLPDREWLVCGMADTFVELSKTV